MHNLSIGVIGLGYVGLPMAALFADRGYKVRGADINSEIVEKINTGRVEINESGVAELVRKVVSLGRFSATTNVAEVVRGSDVIIIIVQTPVDREGIPDLRALENACRTVAQNLSKRKLVIIESTIPPGATERIITPILESGSLKAGSDFYLAYSPERAIPTKTLEEIQTNSRIIGGVNKESAEAAKELYSNITRGELITSDIRTVEVVKLIENTYRDVNIALANEIALLCEKLGVDALKAIEIANRHPRVHLHFPGAGVGGHCIPKDPHFLIHRAEELGIELKVIKVAREVNESMPQHILELVKKALQNVNKTIENSKISILGIAYKGNTDDVRGTPSKKIIEELLQANCEVFSHDPFVSQDFGGKFSNDLSEVLRDSDCVVIVTDHDAYKRMDLKEFAKSLKKPSVIVDGRRILNPEEVEKEGISYFGVGR
ncbi:MAG: nucleotide sugar dehydrogenase [Euryarchaeota archaeon]|nr:nucleotide sugar dehydrogenase [Euryarchaeota archaeon]